MYNIYINIFNPFIVLPEWWNTIQENNYVQFWSLLLLLRLHGESESTSVCVPSGRPPMFAVRDKYVMKKMKKNYKIQN